MKRLAVILGAIVLLLVTAGGWAGELPAPFERAKYMALSGEQSQSNPSCYSVEKKVVIDSVDYIYIIGFCKSDGSLILLKVDGPMGVAIVNDGQEYLLMFFAYGMVVNYEIIPQEKAIEEAFKFFREMVDHRLI